MFMIVKMVKKEKKSFTIKDKETLFFPQKKVKVLTRVFLFSNKRVI